MSAPKQVFLSYSREDSKRVKPLYNRLSSAGFRPWMDVMDIKGGENWENAIRKAVRESDYFIACLSNNSVSRRGVLQKELHDALDVRREKLDSDIYLIPVRLEPCEMPESLAALQSVDLFEDEGFDRLIDAMGGERAARTPDGPNRLRRASIAVAAAVVLGIAGWLYFRPHREPAAEFSRARVRPEQRGGQPRIGLTLWRLRPAAASDPAGIRMLLHEPAEPRPAEWTAVRIDPALPTAPGAKLRLGIESQQHGFLYVVGRERYDDGGMGDPYLIFPTLRIASGNNEMIPGRVVEIPSPDDKPPYLTLQPQAPRYKGEVLSILLAPEPLKTISTGSDQVRLGAAIPLDWERRWTSKVRPVQSDSTVGNTITAPEFEAGRSSTRRLVHGDPLPQTIYSFDTGWGEPLLLTLALQVENKP